MAGYSSKTGSVDVVKAGPQCASLNSEQVVTSSYKFLMKGLVSCKEHQECAQWRLGFHVVEFLLHVGHIAATTDVSLGLYKIKINNFYGTQMH